MASEHTDPATTSVMEAIPAGGHPTAATPDQPALAGRTAAASRRPRTLVTLLLAGALVAAAVALVFQATAARHTDALRTEAVTVARDYSVALSSFDFQTLDANRDKVVAMSTPAFAGKYNEMVDALRQIVTEGKGQATATAEHVGIESLDDSAAAVLVFVDQQAKNVLAPEGNSQKYRMVVSLVRDGDRWLVDNVDTK
ncbi:mce associated protein mas1a [Rhodococcus kronopolitis]|uniref:Mce associated protein mas1a n=1 Tax=Rhodococcus kronopolitis TaxID=1460226 RepID=A0ABV9FW02_9NOCA